MSELRNWIAANIEPMECPHDPFVWAGGACNNCRTDAVIAVVQPELDTRDSEIASLRDDLRWARGELAKADAENNAAGARAKKAEAERDKFCKAFTDANAHAQGLRDDLKWVRGKLAEVTADGISVARSLLGYQRAVKTTGIKKGARSIGDKDAAMRLIDLFDPGMHKDAAEEVGVGPVDDLPGRES